MLNRIALGVRATAQTAMYGTVTALALGGCYAVYEFVDAGRDRLAERAAPVRERAERARHEAAAQWDRAGAALERAVAKVEGNPELLLTVVLPLVLSVVYYRRKGHRTAEALVAGLTRIPPRAPGADAPPTSSERARNRVTLRELRPTLTELEKKGAALAKDVQVAERNLESKREAQREAEELLADAERDVGAAVATLERLCDAKDAVTAEAEEVLAEIAALEQRA